MALKVVTQYSLFFSKGHCTLQSSSHLGEILLLDCAESQSSPIDLAERNFPGP